MIKMSEECANDGLARYPNIISRHFLFLQPFETDSVVLAAMKSLGLRLANVKCLGGRGSGRGKWEGVFTRLQEEVQKAKERVLQALPPKIDLPLLLDFTPLNQMRSNQDRLVAAIFCCGLLSVRTARQTQIMMPLSLLVQVYSAIYQKGWTNFEDPLIQPVLSSSSTVAADLDRMLLGSSSDVPTNGIAAAADTRSEEYVTLWNEIRQHSRNISAHSKELSNAEISIIHEQSFASMTYLPLLARGLFSAQISSANVERANKTVKFELKRGRGKLKTKNIATCVKIRFGTKHNYFGGDPHGVCGAYKKEKRPRLSKGQVKTLKVVPRPPALLTRIPVAAVAAPLADSDSEQSQGSDADLNDSDLGDNDAASDVDDADANPPIAVALPIMSSNYFDEVSSFSTGSYSSFLI